MTEEKTAINVAIDPNLHKRLKVFAAQNEIKVKDVVAQAIAAFIKK